VAATAAGANACYATAPVRPPFAGERLEWIDAEHASALVLPPPR
jgi:hypothetical protein